MDFRHWGIPIPVPYARDSRGGEGRDDRSSDWAYHSPFNMASMAFVPPFPPHAFDDGSRTPEWGTPFVSPSKGSSSAALSEANNNSNNRELKLKSTSGCRAGARRTGGVSVGCALMHLENELGAARAIFKAYVEQHDADMAQAREYAEESTLDRFWRNMVAKKFKDEREKQRFEGSGDKISWAIATAKDAVAAGFDASGETDERLFEWRARRVRKLDVACDEILALIKRSTSRVAACRDLVEELDSALLLLGPEKDKDGADDQGMYNNIDNSGGD